MGIRNFIFLLHLFLLLVAGASANAQFLTKSNNISFKNLLVDAADEGSVSRVTTLLASGNNPDSRGSFGVTPLMRASLRDHKEVAELLINGGADVNAADEGGATALHLAARQGNQEIVTLLLGKGAKVDQPDNEGWTALMRASAGKKQEVAKSLLAARADVNAKNNIGETPLMQATQSGSLNIVKLLLENGAATEEKSIFGTSATKIARNMDNKSLVDAISASPKKTLPEKTPPQKPQPTISAQKNVDSSAPQAETLATAVKEQKVYFLAQLAATDSQKDAEKLMKNILKKHKAAFAGMDTAVVKSQRDKKNPYRVRTGLFESKKKAVSWCADMRLKNVECFVVETNNLPAEMADRPSIKAANAKTNKPDKKEINSARAIEEDDANLPLSMQRSNKTVKPREVKPVEKAAVPTGSVEIEGLPWLTDMAQVDVKIAPVAEVKQENLRASEPVQPPEQMPAEHMTVQKNLEVDEKNLPASMAFDYRNQKAREATKSKVEVAEAIRVPVTEPPVQRNPVSSEIIPSATFIPSQGESAKGLWLQIGDFHSEEEANQHFRVASQKSGKNLRMRIITPASGGDQVSLRIGLFDNEEEATKACEQFSGTSLTCSFITDTGISSNPSSRKSSGEGYNRAAPVKAQSGYEPENYYLKNRRLYWLHLGTYTNVNEAEERWEVMKSVHKDVVGKLQEKILPPENGSNAKPLYRLQAGPLASSAAAQEACDKLSAKFTSCFVVNE